MNTQYNNPSCPLKELPTFFNLNYNILQFTYQNNVKNLKIDDH